MKILHTESSKGWGGQELRIIKESIGMRKLGHSIYMAVAKDGGLVKNAKENSFKTFEIRFKKIYWPISFFKLIYILLKYKIDVINTHSSDDAWLLGIIGKFFNNIKVIRTRHLSTPVKKGLNSYLLYNFLVDHIATTTKDIIPIIAKQSKNDISNFSFVPTGIDPNLIKKDLEKTKEFRKKHNIIETDVLIGCVCFMRSWKGIMDFLQAVKILKDQKIDENLKWIIIGGGHSQEYIEKANELGLKNDVIFTGHLNDPFYAIDALDIFVLLSSAHEGVSQASLQAAYFEKPLIMTPTGGLKEVCIENVTGIQVPIFSPDKVADAVIDLANDKEKRDVLGWNAKALIEEKFLYKSMIDQMEKICCKK
jgi:glycosyltransferase involved in cell wall biosynthesis